MAPQGGAHQAPVNALFEALGGAQFHSRQRHGVIGEAGDARAGRDMARQWCSSCHVVEPGGRGSDAAPTFAALANRPGAGPERWRTWLANPHPPMPKLQLSRQSIADIADYLSILKQT